MRSYSSTIKAFLLLYFCGMVLVHAGIVWRSRELIRKGFPDFGIYYCAGAVARQGQADHFYDNRTIFAVEQQFAQDVPLFRRSLLYTHPPFEALLFLPFSNFSYVTAYVLWGVLNLILLACVPVLLRPHLPALQSYPAWLWVLAMLAFFPTFYALLEGQDAIVFLFFCSLAFVELKRERWAIAGMWLALGLFKFHLVLPVLLLLLVQKKWKMLIGFLPEAAALGLLSLFMVGLTAARAYPHFVLHVESQLTGTQTVPSDMPSLRGLSYLLLHDATGPLLWTATSAVLLFAAWKCFGGDRETLDLTFALALVTSALIGYHVVSYDLSMLMLAIFLLINHLLEYGNQNRWSAIAILVAIVVFFSPLPMLLAFRFNRFAMVSWILIALFAGISGQLSAAKQKLGRVSL